jgi:hypothetical protein
MIGRIRSFLLSATALITILAPLMFVGHLLATDDDAKKDEEKQREQQLKIMRGSAAMYTVSPAEDRKQLFKLHENAIMRFSNPVGGTKDGAIFLWSHRGRLQAIIKLYTYDNENFSHEWQSLSESALVAEREGKVIWNPTDPGVTFHELTDAPKPAESATERLRQMKTLAGKFSSTYLVAKDSKPTELRLLIQPMFRLDAGEEAKILDGALFGFAQGTAPMAFVLFEARLKGEGHRWYYAFSRLATGAVTARFGDKEIYSVARYDFRRDPQQTFLQMHRQPVPKE